MSTSTDGQLCYGYEFAEDARFPWQEEDNDDFESWWAKLSGMPEDANQYTWCRHNPPPVEIVMHCSGEYPMWIIAAAGSLHKAYRGTPVRVENLNVSPEATAALDDFIKKYEIQVEGEAGWILSSLWF